MAQRRQRQRRWRGAAPVPLAPSLLLLLFCLPAAHLLSAAESPQDAGEYVVVFKRGFDAAKVKALCTQQAAVVSGGRFQGLCRQRFSALLNGFAGSLSEADVEALQEAFPGSIEYIERDTQFSITGAAQPDWLHSDRVPVAARQNRRRHLLAEQRRTQRRNAASRRRRLPEQQNPTWNLDRIDQHSEPLDRVYHYDTTGSGVNVYVLDTGIRFSHQEFLTQQGGSTVRARHGFSVFGDDNSTDCNGHGTHTAATIGGLTYGVAKNVTLWAVRAMDCQGDAKVSAILAAFEWVAENAIQPAVVSMSVAGDMSPSVNEAARRLVEDHLITMVVAAGNSYESACLMSPASSPWVISVAASDDEDRRWGQSNWGPCVDVHAPGVSVLSAVSASDSSTQTKTGTSMAAPHVAGVVSLYLEKHPGASPTEVRQKLNAAATPDAVGDDPDGFGTWDPASNPVAVDISATPNRLLYSQLMPQAVLEPGVLYVDDSSVGPITVTVVLSAAPSGDVGVSVAVPMAAWANSSLATVTPGSLTFSAASWNVPQVLTIQPSLLLVDGTYHVTLSFASEDPRFSDGMQTIKVVDSRPLSGDSLQQPRIVPQLPFSDTDVSTRFSDKYLYNSGDPSGNGAPDVVYAYTPSADVAVDISTCGSLFDTKLYIFDDPVNLQVYVGNDDDPSCQSNPKASRLSTTFQAGTTYYIVVDGFSGTWLDSQGMFSISITPSTATS